MIARFAIPAAITLVMVAVLSGLGAWQIERKGEKEALIAALDARVTAVPQPLPPRSEWSALTPERDEFRRVRFSGTYKTGEADVYAGVGSTLRADIASPGVWVFGAVSLPDGATIVVDRGFAADSERNGIAPPQGSAELIGVLRFPEKPGLFTPKEDRSKQLWFARDHRAMADAAGWGEVAPFYVDLEQPVPPGGVPKPGPVEVHLRNEHLQYAVTWFGLALVVLASFLVWLRQQWRRQPPR